MAQVVYRLKSRRDVLRREQAEQLRQLILALGKELPERPVGELLGALDRVTESSGSEGWRFILLGPEEFNLVADWLDDHSKMPRLAGKVWRQLHRFIDPVTNEILRGRDELAELAGAYPQDISTVMNELVSTGAVLAERKRVAGMRGPGAVRWYLNKRIACCLPGRAREKAQADSPSLRLVTGGKL